MPEPELTPGQETPPAETPPATPSSVETPAAPETPAQPISGEVETPAAPAEVPTAPPAEKTPEQVAADKAYFQDEARKAKEELSALKSAPPETPPAAEPPVPAVPATPATQPPYGEPPPYDGQDVNTYLRDNPVAALTIMTDTLKQHLNETLEKHDQRREFESQQRESNRVLTNFCANNDISRDELSEAHTYVKNSGLNGSPVAITSTIIDRLQFQKLVGSGHTVVMDAAAKAAAAAKTAALLMQPDGSLPATPAKPTTPEEIVRSKFKQSPQKVKIDEILGRAG